MMLTILQTGLPVRGTQTGLLPQIHRRAYLMAYLQRCAEHGGQAPKDLDGWLPWNYRPKQTALGP